jgi:hypothetical protein
VPDNLVISIYKRAEAGKKGTYALRGCVRPLNGETQTANNCTTTPTRAVTINSACHVAALDPIAAVETGALELERNRRNRKAPDTFVSPPLLVTRSSTGCSTATGTSTSPASSSSSSPAATSTTSSRHKTNNIYGRSTTTASWQRILELVLEAKGVRVTEPFPWATH